MALIQMTMTSFCLKRSVQVNAYIPCDPMLMPGMVPDAGPWKTIYLLHGFFLDGRIEMIENVRLAVCGEPAGLSKIAAALLWSLIVYLVCYLPVWLLRRIPGIRDLTL